MVAQDYISSKKTKYDNAKKITEKFILYDDGRIAPLDGVIDSKVILPRGIDIVSRGNNLFVISESGEVSYYCFRFEEGYYHPVENRYVEKCNEYLQKFSNVKQINFSWKSEHYTDIYRLTIVQADGKAYNCVLSRGYESYFEDIYEVAPSWNNINSCIPVGNIFMALNKDNTILAHGGEFSVIGGETPKLLMLDNVLQIYSFYGTHSGKSFNYAVVLCEDGSIYAYWENGTFPQNISEAFSKWKSFEII